MKKTVGKLVSDMVKSGKSSKETDKKIEDAARKQNPYITNFKITHYRNGIPIEDKSSPS